MPKYILNHGTGDLDVVPGTENDPPTLGEKILTKGFKDNPLPSDTVKQLENLRDWSLDPLKYVENQEKNYTQALKNFKKFTTPNKIKKNKSMVEPKIDTSPLLIPRREVPIIPPELKAKRDPDLDKGLGIFQKQFRFDE